MTKLANVARPYAKAVFSYATEHRALEQWSALLAQWSLVAQDPMGRAYLQNPTVLVAQKIAFLKQWLVQEIAVPAENFLAILATARRLRLLPEIAVQFERLKRKALDQLLVLVTSSEALSLQAKQRLVKTLTTRFGKTILLEEAVDPTLIGGVLIMAEDLFIDGSIKGKLNHLADAMKMRVG